LIEELKNGVILISEPFMQDHNFKKTVILLADYTSNEGSVGFVLNRPTNLKIHELIGSFPEFDSKVYYGGPVGIDTIHYVHRKGDLIEGSRLITDGLYWGGDFNQIKFLVANEVIGNSDIRFFIGYSGWSAGQLEEEMDTKSWLLGDVDLNYIFASKIPNMWKHVMHVKGANFKVIADTTDYQSLN
jgi:putative transcriptional regulator